MMTFVNDPASTDFDSSIKLTLTKDPFRPETDYTAAAAAAGPTDLRAVPVSEEVKYKVLTVQYSEFKKVIHSKIVMEWVVNKSTEIQNYIKQVAKYHRDRLYWNFVKDPVTAKTFADTAGEAYPTIKRDASGGVFQPS